MAVVPPGVCSRALSRRTLHRPPRRGTGVAERAARRCPATGTEVDGEASAVGLRLRGRRRSRARAPDACAARPLFPARCRVGRKDSHVGGRSRRAQSGAVPMCVSAPADTAASCTCQIVRRPASAAPRSTRRRSWRCRAVCASVAAVVSMRSASADAWSTTFATRLTVASTSRHARSSACSDVCRRIEPRMRAPLAHAQGRGVADPLQGRPHSGVLRPRPGEVPVRARRSSAGPQQGGQPRLQVAAVRAVPARAGAPPGQEHVLHHVVREPVVPYQPAGEAGRHRSARGRPWWRSEHDRGLFA